ncbi:MltA domain-containing protein [Pseudodesulfovibrio pelocollis]|uniref:MltA domain-containing protein n=1 Tax=Pseudodesulfovibrio pelocollis TaxID=3051432 RepID=UPI00255AB188|nr:MltA domain-containing protein [Pseudodesulfovibrio sp. SB368]
MTILWRDATALRAAGLVLVVLCAAGLAACVKGGPFFGTGGTASRAEGNGTVAACDKVAGSVSEVGLQRSRATGVLTLKPLTDLRNLPTCDLFFPLSNTEGAQSNARIDLASQGLSSWADLAGPAQRSLEYAMNMPRDRLALTRPGMTLTWGQVVRSLEEFLELLPHLDENPHLLASRFVWFGMRQKPLMTGYYTPEIQASLTKKPGYEFPIYGVPDDLRSGLVRGKRAVYRVERGRVLPYHDRGDVDVRGVLAGRGLEIAWAKDPVDVFYMQVEGAGRLLLPDGTTRNVLYGAKNGHEFRSLGLILHARGLLPRARLSKAHVKEFFAKHPETMFELMAENRSYVFFRMEDSPPEGAMGKPLTPMVSLATDRELLPLGSLLAFEAEIPRSENGRNVGKRTVAGIGLAQDVGTAIRGPRLDYYIGEGNQVEPIANNIMTEATVYLLISKEALING